MTTFVIFTLCWLGIMGVLFVFAALGEGESNT